MPELAKWLKKLPKPLALFACNDTRANQVLNVCNTYNINVPQDVAVLGVDNDPVECELSNPPLSSVDPQAERIGYEAAALLHRMFNGYKCSRKRICFPPRGIAARRSTDVLAIQNTDAADAINYLRCHALEPSNFSRILSNLSYSRSTLERWFRQYLGHSVKEEIVSIRLKRIQELLLTTNYSLDTIAPLCGFSHVESMIRLFKKHVGSTPGEYRNMQFRSH